MKKFLLLLLFLLILFGGFIFYDTYSINIPTINVEEEKFDVDELFVYGTHLNIKGNIINDENLELVLYNGEFRVIDINIIDSRFNLSDYINDGLYLDDIPVGKYYLFFRSKVTNDNEDVEYKYYVLNNTTEYKETNYYTFSTFNKKIIINSDNDYNTLMLNVTKNKETDVYDIVIDPGHGGRDVGAIGNSYYEADITMDFAVKLKKKLEDIGLKVKLTHEPNQLSDEEKLSDYGSDGRVSVPYQAKAKYLFSIHMNSSTSKSLNGLEVYTASGINYNFAKLLVNNIVTMTDMNYSSGKINKVYDGIYTRTFTTSEIIDSKEDYQDEGIIPYEIKSHSNYYYIIRETGGIMTGAYVDDRNTEIDGNPYVNSNIGAETYLLELGYISNKNNLDYMINNIDKYVDCIASSISTLYNKEDDTKN